MTITLLIKMIIDYLNKHAIVKSIVIFFCFLIFFIILVNIFSKFLQNMDYLAQSLKRHISNLFRLIKFIIKWIFRFVFMPFVFVKIKQEYDDINMYIVNNSRYKDVS